MNNTITISKQEFDKLVRRVESLERRVGAVKKPNTNRVKKQQQAEGIPTASMKKALAQAEKDGKGGWVSPAFDKAEDAIAWLHNPNARYQNGHYVREEV